MNITTVQQLKKMWNIDFFATKFCFSMVQHNATLVVLRTAQTNKKIDHFTRH